MTDPAILFIKPGAVSPDDKTLLIAAGILVVEIENPQDAKFVRPYVELDGNELLKAAMEGLRGYDAATRDFGKALMKALLAKQSIQSEAK